MAWALGIPRTQMVYAPRSGSPGLWRRRHGAPSLACEHIVTMKDPLFAPIRFAWDLENRRARIEASMVTCFRTRQ